VKAFLLFAIVSCFCIITTAQKKSVTIQDNHGKITIEEETYNRSYSNFVLNVNKFIDTSKHIIVQFGSGLTIDNYPIYLLKHGYELPVLDYVIISPRMTDELEILRIKLVNGHLLLSGSVNSFDQKYICRIKENVLYESKQYHLYASDSYFEIFDDYYIPVLQIELDKAKNQIYVGGAFALKQGYIVAGKGLGCKYRIFPNPILLMRQSQRDSAFYEFLDFAKKITPIHE
jgi:hypothetical protein